MEAAGALERRTGPSAPTDARRGGRMTARIVARVEPIAWPPLPDRHPSRRRSAALGLCSLSDDGAGALQPSGLAPSNPWADLRTRAAQVLAGRGSVATILPLSSRFPTG
jgi:hypothetical protein